VFGDGALVNIILGIQHLLYCNPPTVYFAINIAQYMVSPCPPCFAIQHRILFMAISCKGQITRQGREWLSFWAGSAHHGPSCRRYVSSLICVYICVCVCVCMYICIYICVYVYMYIYIMPTTHRMCLPHPIWDIATVCTHINQLYSHHQTRKGVAELLGGICASRAELSQV